MALGTKMYDVKQANFSGSAANTLHANVMRSSTIVRAVLRELDPPNFWPMLPLLNAAAISALPSPMSSGKPVLLLAYHFPPDNASGSARPFRFYKYLPEYGYEPHVITASA